MAAFGTEASLPIRHSVVRRVGEDCEITKEECINHLWKRLGTALRKVAAEGRQEGVVTVGRAMAS